MADPVTLAVISAGTKFLGGIAQANAQQSQYAAQARAAEYNAQIARQNAATVQSQTEAQLETQDRERRLRLGASMAAAGASGLDTSGFGDILSSSAAQEQLDLLTLQSEGMLKKRGFESEAAMQSATAQSIKSQAKLSKAASVMSGISSMASMGAGGFGGGSTGGADPNNLDVYWKV